MRFQRKLLALDTQARLRGKAEWQLFWTYSVEKLRRRTLLIQLFGMLGWALSRFFARPGAPFDMGITIAGLCCAAMGLTTTALSRNRTSLTIGSCLSTLAITLCIFNSNIVGAEHPEFWVLPVGLMITVGMAPLFVDSWSFLFAAVVVWALVSFDQASALLQAADSRWIVLLVAGCTVLGAILNHLFFLERKKNFLVQRELIRLSFYDALTGICNRRGLMELLQEGHAHASTQESYFLLIDIDDFKYINDTYGHEAGDAVLIEVATQIKRYANHHPHGRLGGEEFGVLVPGSANAVTRFVAELCDHIASLRIYEHPVTVSVGIARMRASSSLSDVLRLADQGMYEAKQNGKNGYVMVP